MIVLRNKRSGYPVDEKTGRELPRPRWDDFDEDVLIEVEIDQKTYSADMARVKFSSKDKTRIRQLKKSIKNGNVFDNSPEDPTEYTHLIGESRNSYIYSKDINGSDRMTYTVHKIEN